MGGSSAFLPHLLRRVQRFPAETAGPFLQVRPRIRAMTRSRKKEWGDYLWGVAMAIGFSIPVLVFVPHFFDGVPVIPKVILWGWSFGTMIYLSKAVSAKVRHRSFLLTVLAQSILIYLAIFAAFIVCF